MNLYFHGHDYKYAAEQMLLTLFPQERPVYPDHPPAEGADRLVLTLEEGDNGRLTARADLLFQGRRAAPITYHPILPLKPENGNRKSVARREGCPPLRYRTVVSLFVP